MLLEFKDAQDAINPVYTHHVAVSLPLHQRRPSSGKNNIAADATSAPRRVSFFFLSFFFAKKRSVFAVHAAGRSAIDGERSPGRTDGRSTVVRSPRVPRETPPSRVRDRSWTGSRPPRPEPIPPRSIYRGPSAAAAAIPLQSKSRRSWGAQTFGADILSSDTLLYREQVAVFRPHPQLLVHSRLPSARPLYDDRRRADAE